MTRRARALWLPGALACGAFLAWMDSSPGWDDTGITVALVLACSAAFGALRPRWAWAAALAIGVGIPLVEIPAGRSAGSLAAVAFALAGAYLGAFVRRLLGAEPPPASG